MARGQAYDGIVTSQLSEIISPAGLREAILAGARVSQTKVHPWRQPARIAMGLAAAIVLVGVAFTWSKRLATNDHRLVELALQDTVARHCGHGEKLTAAQAKLSDPTVHLGEGLKLDFAALRETGCRTVAINGQEVFEICFNRNGSRFHLYAMAEPAQQRAAGETGVKVVQRDKFSCATWYDPIHGLPLCSRR